MELYKKYRPRNLGEMIGQNIAVRVLESAFEKDDLPHTILFTGPSGCGKTTFARIIRRRLKCSKHDYEEAAPRKIEDVREIRRRINQAPLKSECRIWLVDECHKLTSDAQDEFLKMLEDTPSHVYFIFTTTIPEKLKATIRNRCTEIVVKLLHEQDLVSLIDRTCKSEKKKISEAVIEKIVDNSNGSPRKALVFLNKVINLKSKTQMLNAIITTTAERQAIEIARALINPKTKWHDMAKILRETEGEEAEQVRWLILSYVKKVILGGGKSTGRAYLIIDAFRDNFYDSKAAGLAAACYEVVEGTR